MSRKTFTLILGLLIVLLILTGCSEDSGLAQLDVNNNFSEDDNGWESGFADLPAEYDNALYELESGRRELPSGLSGYGMYLQGHNRSDDLFMYLTKKVTGLMPDHVYNLTFAIEFATNVAGGGVGIGGSPGESVFVKAGASTDQPIAEEQSDGFFRMNIDKGNQSTAGRDMVVIGDVASPDVVDEAQYALKSLSADGLEASTDGDGNLWLILGTDSGYEGLTTIYFTHIEVSLTAKE